MKSFIVLSALVAVALARPGHLLDAHHHVSHVLPVSYAKLVPAAPIGHDGRVVDTPEVAHAKAAHAAAHAHEKIALVHEAANSADHLSHEAPVIHHVATTTYHHAAPVAHVAASYHGAQAYHAIAPVAYAKVVPAAPIGHDGRVVDTPEVAHAKAEHLAAHQQAKAASHHDSHYDAHHQW